MKFLNGILREDLESALSPDTLSFAFNYLATGRDEKIIYGSVSLDDETLQRGFTEVVVGFHKHLAEWQEAFNRPEWGGPQSYRVYPQRSLLEREDAERYGDFVPVPCQLGEACKHKMDWTCSFFIYPN